MDVDIATNTAMGCAEAINMVIGRISPSKTEKIRYKFRKPRMYTYNKPLQATIPKGHPNPHVAS